MSDRPTAAIGTFPYPFPTVGELDEVKRLQGIGSHREAARLHAFAIKTAFHAVRKATNRIHRDCAPNLGRDEPALAPTGAGNNPRVRA
jgi:hypothetical protein